MTGPQKILVVYGTMSLVYGFVLGIPLSQIRTRSPEAPRHLVIAHLSALIQGAVHLGLSVAIGFADLPLAWQTAGAASLVVGSALFVTGSTVNWLQRIGDHFAVRSIGWKLLSVSGIAHLAGIAIVAFGVLRAI